MAARRRSWTGDDEAPALLFATDGASAGQRSDLEVCITPSACVRETARLMVFAASFLEPKAPARRVVQASRYSALAVVRSVLCR
jgi:hypothetical protein